ncbi:MAG: glycosyltransferase [Spirochaetales bacterium]|nr:glycosyltransferase [Spirochaetales bacterium]
MIVFLLASVYFLLLSASNLLWLRASSPRRMRKVGPRVSVLVPCRNEERNIGRCLDSLVRQSYASLEVVALDDRSSDATWEVICGYARRHPRLVRAVQGQPLPAGRWYGKPHALQQLADCATGEYLMFTDADTVHGPDSVAWAVASLRRHGADCVSGYVRQELRSFGELLIVPVMYIMSALFLPLWLIHCTRSPALSFAIGQLMVFRRNALQTIGGFEGVSERISDDVFLAREVKRAGLKLVFLDAQEHVRCRMYEGYQAAFAGISKNIYDFFKHRPLFFLAASAVLVALVLLPLVLACLQLVLGDPAARLTSLAPLLFLAAWTATLRDRGLPGWAGLLYPVTFVHLLYMSWRSFRLVQAGAGIMWKGRLVR